MRVGTGGAITVTATEVWLSEIRAGRAAIGGAYQAAVAAQLSHIQLLNPVGSGKQILMRYLIVSALNAQALNIRRYDTALTTDSGSQANLLLGGAVPLGQVRTQTNAAALGTSLGSFYLPASTPVPLAPDWIAELSPGQGILFAGTVVNLDLAVTYFWREV